METIQLLILITVLVILAEVSFLVSRQQRRALVRRAVRTVFVDTSVLMDGRILSVVQTGFIGDTLVIPRSVIGELQFLADNADHDKRLRARGGLDAVAALQASDKVDVQIFQDGAKADEGVDERLLKLAKKHDGIICTLDFNLSKVATVEGITVLNLNELAQSIRMAHLPGDRMRLELVQKGQDSHQAVGYLADGTMVVVEQANRLIGQSADIEVIRSLQTAAGRMMFARLVDASTSKPQTQTQKPTGKRPVAEQVARKTKKQRQEQVSAPQPEQPQPTREQKQQRQPKQDQPAVDQTKATSPRQKNQPKQTESRKASSNQRRPKTQAQREAAFIDLVDQQ